MLLGSPLESARAEQLSRVEPQLLDRVLTPYKAHCRYLQGAAVRYPHAAHMYATASGTFVIPESCYIASTGHFNAVEFNICYNQLTYCLLAKCIDDKALDVFVGWTLPEFSRRQLSDYLIAKFSSTFHKPITTGQFTGEVAITHAAVRRGVTFMKTVCRFADAAGGRADGGATIAIVDAVQTAHQSFPEM